MEYYGYVKANKLTSDYILRQDMEKREEATIIPIEDYNNKEFNILSNFHNKTVKIEEMLNINNNNIEVSAEDKSNKDNYEIWVPISNRLLETQTSVILREYKNRTSLINLIVDKAINVGINGIVIDFKGIEEKNTMKRFVIELAPKLREIGIKTCIVLGDNIEKDDYINVVDYIIE